MQQHDAETAHRKGTIFMLKIGTPFLPTIPVMRCVKKRDGMAIKYKVCRLTFGYEGAV